MRAKIGAKRAAGTDAHTIDEVRIGKDLVANSIALLRRKNARTVRNETNEDQSVRPMESGARLAAATAIARIDTIIIVRHRWNGRCRQ